jgi:hypothetical protein
LLDRAEPRPSSHQTGVRSGDSGRAALRCAPLVCETRLGRRFESICYWARGTSRCRPWPPRGRPFSSRDGGMAPMASWRPAATARCDPGGAHRKTRGAEIPDAMTAAKPDGIPATPLRRSVRSSVRPRQPVLFFIGVSRDCSVLQLTQPPTYARGGAPASCAYPRCPADWCGYAATACRLLTAGPHHGVTRGDCCPGGRH